MNKSEKIRLCAWIVLCGFVFSVLFHYAQAFYLRMPYPFSTFLFVPGDVWGDFYGLVQMNRGMDPFNNTYAGFGNNYPPFCYLALMPFTELGYRVGSIVFGFLFVTGFLYFVVKVCRRAGSPGNSNAIYIFILCFLTYPFLFSLERLNAENLMLMFCGFFYLWFSERRGPHWVSGIALGLATAMKIYTGAFALVLAAERKYWPILGWSAIVAVVATVSAFFFLNVTPAEVQLAYERSYPKFMEFTLSEESLQHTSSLFAAVRIVQILGDYSALRNTDLAMETFNIYRYIAVILGLVFAAACLFGRLSLWERLTLAVVIILLLPPVSFDYKLTYLFIPLAAFFNSPTSRKTALVFCCLFGALLIPKGWWILVETASVGVLINVAVLLVVACILTVRAMFPSKPIAEPAGLPIT